MLPGRLCAEGSVAASSRAKAVNPHGSPTGCRECHKTMPVRPGDIPLDQVDGICIQCHDGKRAKKEPHPIGGTFDGESVVLPKGWPAPGGKVSCVTCHDVHMDRAVGRGQVSNAHYLRGKAFGDLGVFCANCHRREAFSRYNPHRMIGVDGRPNQQACLFCHSRPMEAGALGRTGSAALKGDQMSLCGSCHGMHKDYFDPGHLGAKVPPGMLGYVAATEKSGPGKRPSRELVASMRRAGASPKSLALSESGGIVCATCHNPHEQGVFRPESELARGAMPRVNRDHHFVNAISRRLCIRCHPF